VPIVLPEPLGQNSNAVVRPLIEIGPRAVQPSVFDELGLINEVKNRSNSMRLQEAIFLTGAWQ
jgi:hypothetical protein